MKQNSASSSDSSFMKQNMGTLIKNIVSKTAVIILTSKLQTVTDHGLLKMYIHPFKSKDFEIRKKFAQNAKSSLHCATYNIREARL